jgi:hypothetical protein
VRRPIRNRLWRERFDTAQESVVRDLLQQLRSRAAVSVNEAALAQVHIQAEPQQTPVPAGAAGNPAPR